MQFGRKSIFNHNEVRDLYWILKGPGLLNPNHPTFTDRLLKDEWFQETAKQGQEWFRSLDKGPKALIEDLANRENPTTLLGRYFEALLSFWIREYLKPEVFHAGVPVHEHEASLMARGRKTIGEFDFLFRLPSPGGSPLETLHWEASVKFYLFAGENAEQAARMDHYFGTYLKDRLDIKVSRIFNHQLKLSETPDAMNLLSRLALTSPRPQAWVKGMLFYPAQSDWRHHPYPPEISPFHQRGWWTEASALDMPVENPDDRWVILPKYRWLSPAMVDPKAQPDQALFTLDEMKEHCRSHFAEHFTPIMWAETTWDATSQIWREVNRGLVVYSGWLDAALSSLGRSLG